MEALCMRPGVTAVSPWYKQCLYLDLSCGLGSRPGCQSSSVVLCEEPRRWQSICLVIFKVNRHFAFSSAFRVSQSFLEQILASWPLSSWWRSPCTESLGVVSSVIYGFWSQLCFWNLQLPEQMFTWFSCDPFHLSLPWCTILVDWQSWRGK